MPDLIPFPGATQAPAPAPVKPGYQTSELYIIIASLLKNALLMLVMTGKISADSASHLTDSLLVLLAVGFQAIPETVAIWKFIHSRTELKAPQAQPAPAQSGGTGPDAAS